jgi:hypothetical protein
MIVAEYGEQPALTIGHKKPHPFFADLLKADRLSRLIKGL